MKHVLVYGNPFDGLQLCGPFDTAETANEYAENNLRNEEWWIVEMIQP